MCTLRLRVPIFLLPLTKAEYLSQSTDLFLGSGFQVEKQADISHQWLDEDCCMLPPELEPVCLHLYR